MPPSKKTDNANLIGKLFLRRYFLQKYPPNSVFDCCQGGKAIWGPLLEEYPVKYLGVDVKAKKGRLSIDSNRIISQPGWSFDVVDIDTYGSPWLHWQSVLTNADHDLTVFLTIGLVKIMGGRISNEVVRWLGFDKFSPKIPSSLASKCAGMAIPYCLGQAEKHGFKIIEAKSSDPSKNAEYIGIKLCKLL